VGCRSWERNRSARIVELADGELGALRIANVGEIGPILIVGGEHGTAELLDVRAVEYCSR